MDSTELAARSINDALDYLKLAVGDINDDQYNWQPPGTGNPIAKIHIHAASAVDFFINGLIAGQAPVWAEHAAKVGVPMMPGDLWPAATRIARAGVDEYVAAMRESIQARLAALTDDIFAREFDTPFAGKQPGVFLLTLSMTHTAAHAGEISALKGVQGLKGLPF